MLVVIMPILEPHFQQIWDAVENVNENRMEWFANV